MQQLHIRWDHFTEATLLLSLHVYSIDLKEKFTTHTSGAVSPRGSCWMWGHVELALGTSCFSTQHTIVLIHFLLSIDGEPLVKGNKHTLFARVIRVTVTPTVSTVWTSSSVVLFFCFYRKFYSTYIFQQKGNIQEYLSYTAATLRILKVEKIKLRCDFAGHLISFFFALHFLTRQKPMQLVLKRKKIYIQM